MPEMLHDFATRTGVLPPDNTRRWVISRKAQVVKAVKNGLVSLDEVCRRYTLSVEEFAAWEKLIETHGVHGLRTTRLREYRPAMPSSSRKAKNSRIGGRGGQK